MFLVFYLCVDMSPVRFLSICEGSKKEEAMLEVKGRTVSAKARFAINIKDGRLVDFY